MQLAIFTSNTLRHHHLRKSRAQQQYGKAKEHFQKGGHKRCQTWKHQTEKEGLLIAERCGMDPIDAKSGTTSRPRKTNRTTPSTNAQRLTEITLAWLEDRKCRPSWTCGGAKEPRTLFSLSFVLGTLSHAAGTSHANFGKAQETSEGEGDATQTNTEKDSKT